MDAHSLKILEYSKVIARLAAHTSNGIGREFAEQLEPLPYPETVTRRLQETREARMLRDHDSGLPLGGIHDVRATVERARIGTRLTPRELLEVLYTVGAARRLRMYILNRQEKCPLLSEMATNIPILQIVESRIEACISESPMCATAPPPNSGGCAARSKSRPLASQIACKAFSPRNAPAPGYRRVW